VRQLGTVLDDGLSELVQRRPEIASGVRGAGLLRALCLSQPVAERVARRALELGLLLNAPRPTTLRLMPSLRVDEAEIAEMLELLAQAL
jgi:acetylornithine/N-succinyldiaminopimelate aminotransferase